MSARIRSAESTAWALPAISAWRTARSTLVFSRIGFILPAYLFANTCTTRDCLPRTSPVRLSMRAVDSPRATASSAVRTSGAPAFSSWLMIDMTCRLPRSTIACRRLSASSVSRSSSASSPIISPRLSRRGSRASLSDAAPATSAASLIETISPSTASTWDSVMSAGSMRSVRGPPYPPAGRLLRPPPPPPPPPSSAAASSAAALTCDSPPAFFLRPQPKTNGAWPGPAIKCVARAAAPDPAECAAGQAAASAPWSAAYALHGPSSGPRIGTAAALRGSDIRPPGHRRPAWRARRPASLAARRERRAAGRR